MAEDQLKKGNAAPLEGAIPEQVMGVLNLAFGVMTMGRCLDLAARFKPQIAPSALSPSMQANRGPQMPKFLAGGLTPKTPR